MSLLLELLNHPLTHRAGWVLLHSLWQGAIIAAIFGLLRFTLRAASANARYVAGCLSLCMLAAAPLVTFFVIQPETGTSRAVHTGPVAAGTPAPVSVFKGLDALQVGNTASSALGRTAEIVERVAPWLTALWLIGVVLFSIRLLRGFWQVQTFKTNGTEPLDSVWIDTLNDLKRRLKLSRPVQLFKSALVEVPMVVGWLRPVILLPASSLTGLSPSQLEAILAHELAHVCRHDYLVNLIQNVVETLMFYHPAVWWISRCIRDEREHCCDDLAVQVCGNRIHYARALATMEELRSAAPRLAFAASGGSLRDRIRRLLGLPLDTSDQVSRPWGLALALVGLALAGLGICVLLAPSKYQASARIRIERVAKRPTTLLGAYPDSPSDPYFMQTELEIIQSPVILNRVINSLHLTEVWGKRSRGGIALSSAEALARLRKRVDLRPVRNTSLVEIRVYSDDPAEAERIANEIAQSYRDYHSSTGLEQARMGIEALKNQLAERESIVGHMQSNVDWLRTELKITDNDPNSLTPAPPLTVETIKQLRAEVIYLESEKIKQETQLKQLKQLKELNPADLRNVIQTALDQPDGELATLISEINIAQQNLIRLEKDVVPAHPSYTNATRGIKDLDDKIDRKVAAILLGLQTRVEVTTAKLNKLRETLDDASANDQALVERSRPYYAAKQQLMEEVRFKQILQLKVAQETTDLQIPRESEVEIIDSAVAPSGPVSPNRVLGAALLASGIVIGLAGRLTLRRKGTTPRVVPAA